MFEIIRTLRRFAEETAAKVGLKGGFDRSLSLQGLLAGETDSNLSSKAHACRAGALRLGRRVRGDCTRGETTIDGCENSGHSATLLFLPRNAVWRMSGPHRIVAAFQTARLRARRNG